MTIYLGPSLVMFAWWYLPRKLIRISQTQRITSIADLISSRYGKSGTLGVIVTLVAVIGTTPYIALQLQSLTLSLTVLTEGTDTLSARTTGFWFALGLGLFAILFGTRSIDANEKHFGVVSAIAVEAVVKLFALIAVGVFVVWGIWSGPAELFATDTELLTGEIYTPRWVTLTFLSATAIICLPRMFQVLVVENADERHLATAAWAFPTYLLLISLFVLPIAISGRALLDDGANPDLYVLSLPLSQGQEWLTMLAFLGGFSAATSMVIVSAIALSTMISNHIVVPLWLAADPERTQTSGDVRNVVLTSRRASIALILLLGYLYYLLTGGSVALASIGLISFAGMAQILPALIGALYWRSANRSGALAGIAVGLAFWLYTLFLPSFEGAFLLSRETLDHGLFGLAALRPQELFGLTAADPLVHSVFWSLSFNVVTFVIVSLITAPGLLERVQSQQFVDAFRTTGGPMLIPRSATSEDLYTLAQRILGTVTAHALFAEVARQQGKSSGLPDADDALIARIERELSGSVGSATAHAMVGQVTMGGQISVDQLIRMADETAQIVEYSQELERQSRELKRVADQLRDANARLTEIGAQKDAFLSQVSHELRTPMTSIRSFSEILRTEADIDPAERQRFVGIIHDESQRLTRLLDEILDLSFLESGRVTLSVGRVVLRDVIDSAVTTTEGLRTPGDIPVRIVPDYLGTTVRADFDRLAQVLINLISNAVKYGTSDTPRIEIAAQLDGAQIHLDVIDNGPGIPDKAREQVFEKFSRLSEVTLAGSAGLGLPISREIMRNFGGDLRLMPSGQGARFRMTLLRSEPVRGAAE